MRVDLFNGVIWKTAAERHNFQQIMFTSNNLRESIAKPIVECVLNPRPLTVAMG